MTTRSCASQEIAAFTVVRPLFGAVVLLALASAACTEKIDRTKFEAVNRAARAVRENTSVGLPLPKLRDLVGAYATEVSLANDRTASTPEKSFMQFHADA